MSSEIGVVSLNDLRFVDISPVFTLKPMQTAELDFSICIVLQIRREV